jgi:putative addiction module component (TIGR02574 family)
MLGNGIKFGMGETCCNRRSILLFDRYFQSYNSDYKSNLATSINMSNHPLLKVEISQLSIAERIQLAEDLWDSIIDRQDEVELDLAQQQELDRRLLKHRQDPDAGSSWEIVKQRLGVSQ